METLHIKLEAEEAINSKKALLSTEINLLNIIKKIQSYRNLRNTELKEKIALRTNLKNLSSEIKKLRALLPKLKQKREGEEEEKISEKVKKVKLEDELKEIRQRLKQLET